MQCYVNCLENVDCSVPGKVLRSRYLLSRSSLGSDCGQHLLPQVAHGESEAQGSQKNNKQ